MRQLWTSRLTFSHLFQAPVDLVAKEFEAKRRKELRQRCIFHQKQNITDFKSRSKIVQTNGELAFGTESKEYYVLGNGMVLKFFSLYEDASDNLIDEIVAEAVYEIEEEEKLSYLNLMKQQYLNCHK